MDKVFIYGWVYGYGGMVLYGKYLLWVVMIGGGENYFIIGLYLGFDVFF